ncbi:hypothetical protein [Siphonobacter sp.]|uniref:hypothetical protein n=1 Tax=Siphonobacter sp. TaxID=1869184 RepID=UPI003B3A4486
MTTSNPILLIGGSGIVGRWTAHFLRKAHPEVPLLIGGRDLAKAKKAAAEISQAEGVKIDLTAEDLGLGDRPVSAVALFFTDERAAGLRFAQSRGVPYLTISPGLHEIAPEIAAYIHKPDAAPIVLGTEWLVGATTIPTLEFVKDFSRVHAITLSALLDEEDAGGPAADADLERQMKTMPLSLTRREGAYVWRSGEEAKTTFRAVDGTEMEAFALAPNDVISLATVTGSPNVQFNLAIGVTSTRRRGEPMSTEIIIELEGEDHSGQALRTRHAVVHPEGQMPLTGFGAAMVLERLIGLDGKPATPAGLYFPYQLLDPTAYFSRLKQMGGILLDLDVL